MTDELLKHSERCDLALVRIKQAAHLVEGIDYPHPFTKLALSLLVEAQTILDEGYTP